MTGFGSFHPAVLFIYYVLALVFSMISMHPLLALASLCGSFLFYAFLNGGRKTLSQFFFCVGMFVIMAGINAMYVHNGETILFFMNDNPITHRSQTSRLHHKRIGDEGGVAGSHECL